MRNIMKYRVFQREREHSRSLLCLLFTATAKDKTMIYAHMIPPRSIQMIPTSWVCASQRIWTDGDGNSIPEASKITKIISAYFQKFAIFWRARSRRYQSEISQESMRLTAFFNLYKICILLHRCNIKILAKNRLEKSAIFVKMQQFFANVLANFKNFS